MNGFWSGLLLAVAWLPMGIVVRLVGVVVGFGLVTRLRATAVRRTAIAVGEAVNVGTVAVAAALPVLSVVAGLLVGGYRVVLTAYVASGAGLLTGAVLSAVITPVYLLVVAYTTDQTPRDVA